MSILSIILGVLMIVGGVFCMFTPFATFLSAGFMIAIMLFMYGIFGVVRFFQKEAGALELISSILAIIVGVIAIVRPGGALVIDGFVLNMVSAWLLVKGLINIIISIQASSPQLLNTSFISSNLSVLSIENVKASSRRSHVSIARHSSPFFALQRCRRRASSTPHGIR